MDKKDRLFELIRGDKNISLAMKGFIPKEKEEVFVVIAYFCPQNSTGEYEEMAETISSLLNSQAEVIRLQAAEIEEMKRIGNMNGKVTFLR